MRSLARLSAFAVVSFHLVSALHADVRHVAPSGQPFTEIQAAIDASSAGDVVVVHPGTYAGFMVDGKALTVCADGVGASAVAAVTGETVVSNLASGRVVLSGLQLTGPSAQCPDQPGALGLRIVGNAGFVLVQSCTVRGGLSSGAGYLYQPPACASGVSAMLLQDNVGGVVLSDLQVSGTTAAWAYHPFGGCCFYSQYYAPSAPGAVVISSRLALMDSVLVGGAGAGAAEGGPGSEGLQLHSTVPGRGAFVMGSTVRGGPGGPGFEDTLMYPGGNGGTGVQVTGLARMHLFSSTIAGGNGGPACCSGYPGGLSGVPVGGLGLEHGYSGQHLQIRAPSVVHPGQSVTFEARGTPGVVVRLFASTDARFFHVPSWRGVLVPGVPAVDDGMTMGVIPASGVLSVSYLVPALASGVSSRHLFVQAYRTDPSGGYALSNARCVTVVP